MGCVGPKITNMVAIKTWSISPTQSKWMKENKYPGSLLQNMFNKNANHCHCHCYWISWQNFLTVSMVLLYFLGAPKASSHGTMGWLKPGSQLEETFYIASCRWGNCPRLAIKRGMGKPTIGGVKILGIFLRFCNTAKHQTPSFFSHLDGLKESWISQSATLDARFGYPNYLGVHNPWRQPEKQQRPVAHLLSMRKASAAPGGKQLSPIQLCTLLVLCFSTHDNCALKIIQACQLIIKSGNNSTANMFQGAVAQRLPQQLITGLTQIHRNNDRWA